jgi:hypothetical protein
MEMKKKKKRFEVVKKVWRPNKKIKDANEKKKKLEVVRWLYK